MSSSVLGAVYITVQISKHSIDGEIHKAHLQKLWLQASHQDFCKVVMSQLYSHAPEHVRGCKNTDRAYAETQ